MVFNIIELRYITGKRDGMKNIKIKDIALIVLSLSLIAVVAFSAIKINKVEAARKSIDGKYTETMNKINQEKANAEKIDIDNMAGYWIGASKSDDEVKIYHISSILEDDIIIKSRRIEFKPDGESTIADSLDGSGFHAEFTIVGSDELEPSLHVIKYGDLVKDRVSVSKEQGFAKLTTGGKRDYMQLYAGGENFYHMARLNQKDLDRNRASWTKLNKDNFYSSYVVDELGLDYGGKSEEAFVAELQKYND